MVKPDAVNVLLVDDQPGKLLSYEVMLEELGENLISTSSAKEALAYLEHAVEARDTSLPVHLLSTEFDNLRNHPQFQNLRGRIGLLQAEFAHGGA